MKSLICWWFPLVSCSWSGHWQIMQFKYSNLVCNDFCSVTLKGSPWWGWILLYRRIFFNVRRLPTCSCGFRDMFRGSPTAEKGENMLFLFFCNSICHLEDWCFPERQLVALSVLGFLLGLSTVAIISSLWLQHLAMIAALQILWFHLFGNILHFLFLDDIVFFFW